MRPKRTPEQTARYNATARQRRLNRRAAGLCVFCGVRAVDQDGLLEKTLVSCALCRAKYTTEAQPRMTNAEWCDECLAAGFHRDDCPKMDSLVSVCDRIERVLQGLQPRRSVPPSLYKAAPSEELTPSTVEDGRSGDEALPESDRGETDFPGLGPKTYTTQGLDKGKIDAFIRRG